MIERAFGLAPAVVVLVFSSNDVEDLRRPALWDRLAESRAAKSRFPLRVVYPLLRRTALWNLGLKAAAQRTARANTAPVPGDGQRAAADKQKLRDQYRHALLALRDRLTARGIALLFVVYPSHQHFNRDSSSPEIADTEWAARTALQGEIPLVDLLPPLRATALPVERLYLLPHDAHPSPEGHAIAGQVVARELAEQPLIRKLCRP